LPEPLLPQAAKSELTNASPAIGHLKLIERM